MPDYSSDEVFEKVKQTLIDALSVEDDEVTNEATLTGDLGAESIDFLDIVFRLEKQFDIKIPQEELFSREVLSNPDYVDDRKLNETGIKALEEAMPHVDLTEFKQDPDIDKLSDVFTVETIVKFIESKLSAAAS